MLETGMLLASRSTGDLDHNRRLALWPRRVFDTLSCTGRRASAALNIFVVETRVLNTGMGRSLLVATRSLRRPCNLNLGLKATPRLFPRPIRIGFSMLLTMDRGFHARHL